MNFKVGEKYTRWEIQKAFGGEYQSYLPQVDYKIVAGCFRKKLNPEAPDEIQVGRGPIVMKKAEILSEPPNKNIPEKKNRIPVFLWCKNPIDTKRCWVYEGIYEFNKLLKDQNILAEAEERSKRYGELAYVLCLKSIEKKAGKN